MMESWELALSSLDGEEGRTAFDPVLADDIQEARRDDFWAQVNGIAPMDDDEAVVACRIMGCTAKVVPWARAVYDRCEELFGRSRKPAFADLEQNRAFESGLDPAKYVVKWTNAVKIVYRFFEHPGRFSELEDVEQVPHELRSFFDQGRRWAAGARGGLFGTTAMLDFAEIDVPTEWLEPVFTGSAIVHGKPAPTETVPAPQSRDVEDMEAEVIGNRPSRRNVVGSPMGGSANGASLNALISNTAKVVALVMGRAGCEKDGATGGDDGMGADNEEGLALTATSVARASAGMSLNAVKTRMVGRPKEGDTSDEDFRPVGENEVDRAVRKEARRMMLSRELSLAPFLENYFNILARTVTRASCLVAVARGFANCY
eukprot:Selendium_serpulae@DN9165_c0_g1_i1.p1